MADLSNSKLLATRSFVNGDWVDARSGARFPVMNPATGEVVAEVADLGAAEAEMAVEAAAEAFETWRRTPAKARATLLRRWHDLILANQEDLARLMTLEQGKVLAETRLEVAYGASFVEWFAEEAKRTYGDVIPGAFNDRRQIAIKQPVGVVGAVTPWNFPNAMICRKAAPALAAGCTFVIRPASETPLSALALAVLAEEAGLPPGVFNVITGTQARAIGQVLTESPLVRKFTFTGSTEVGKALIRQSASTVKKVSMELGGNAPVIVFEDADLDKAVAGAVASKYRNAGQTCICVNRVLVQDTILDAFLEKFTCAVQAFNLGNGLDETVTMGPLINETQVADVHSLVEDAVAKGATLVTGGKCSPNGSCFYEPAILINLTPDMRVLREEIFGPVAPVIAFSSEEEAIRIANETEYGLAAYFYTRDVGRVWRVAEALDFGMVGANEVAITSESVPFGGVKESGLGREGSKYGIDDYLELKYICMGGIE